MYDQAEIDCGFARNLLLYVEGLKTTSYFDLFLNGTSIRNHEFRASWTPCLSVSTGAFTRNRRLRQGNKAGVHHSGGRE